MKLPTVTPCRNQSLVNVTAAFLGLLFFLPLANAGVISIDDLTDTLSFTDTTGRIVAGSSCSGESCRIVMAPPPGAGRGGSFTQARVNIFGPGGGLSDTLEVTNDAAGNFVFTFLSDSETGGLTALPAPAAMLVEDGTFLQAWRADWTFTDPTLNFSDFIRIRSDNSTDPRVPEPTILSLFGLGLAAVGWSRRRKASYPLSSN